MRSCVFLRHQPGTRPAEDKDKELQQLLDGGMPEWWVPELKGHWYVFIVPEK